MSGMSPTRRNIVLAGLAIGLFIVAGVIFSRSDASADYPSTYMLDGVCLQCKQDGRLQLKTAQIPPYECPHCHERAFYPWFYCSDCKVKFVPNLVKNPGGGRPHGLPVVPMCSECGGPHVGNYIPTDPEQSPTGVADLPGLP
jgi:DNA-directed RNA polymerase subunit RPC12/RpoP